MRSGSIKIVQIDIQDSHGEIEREIAVLVVPEKDTQKLVPDIDFSRVILAGPRAHLHLGIEGSLEVGIELSQFFGLQGVLRPIAILNRVFASQAPACKGPGTNFTV
jgi:hypothetical protein